MYYYRLKIKLDYKKKLYDDEKHKNTNFVDLVCKQTIPTRRPLLVSEVSIY
jgi:hypothetical protein